MPRTLKITLIGSSRFLACHTLCTRLAKHPINNVSGRLSSITPSRMNRKFTDSPCRGLQILPNSKALSGLGIALAAHFSEAGSSYRILLWLLGVQKVTEVIG